MTRTIQTRSQRSNRLGLEFAHLKHVLVETTTVVIKNSFDRIKFEYFIIFIGDKITKGTVLKRFSSIKTFAYRTNKKHLVFTTKVRFILRCKR